MNHLISVCIPTYNGQKFFKETLESIIFQTYKDFEILIVDDQSTDDTYAIALDYAQKDKRIKLIRNKKNLGLVGNWNRCIELAQGEWIKFVFQDDLIAADCLEKMLASANSDHKMIFCRRNFIFDDTTSEVEKTFYLDNAQKIDKLFLDTSNISPESYSKYFLQNGFSNIVGEPTVVLLNRSLFYDFGLFNNHLIQVCDYEFWTRIAVHTGITYLPETLATFRVHGDATSSKNHQLRYYRSNILDPLILLHDLALHPIYKPLRSIALQNSPSIDLTSQLRNYARKAYILAKKHRDLSLLAEWNQILETYPCIQVMSKISYLEEVIEYVKKLKHFFLRIKYFLQQSGKRKQAPLE